MLRRKHRFHLASLLCFARLLNARDRVRVGNTEWVPVHYPSPFFHTCNNLVSYYTKSGPSNCSVCKPLRSPFANGDRLSRLSVCLRIILSALSMCARLTQTDFGISTFKKKEDTEEGRDKYVSVLAVLLAGSFIIPMVQYWWYVRDDDRPIK